MESVSVVMATYNGEKFLKEQLDSILRQTYPIQEIIIQDDCSTDETTNIVEEYAKKHPQIKLYVNEHNLGVNQNFKTAAMRATGNFIAISDQDDIWFPEKIERQVKAIGDFDICGSAYKRGIDIDDAYIHLHQSSFEALLFCPFAGHTMLLKSSFIKAKESWIDNIAYDWSLAINAQLNNGIVMLDEPLNWHRTHDESACTKYNKQFYKPTETKPTYLPYLYGLFNYYHLQRKPKWQELYTYIYNRSNKGRLAHVHKMSCYMLKRNPIALFMLCIQCLKYRKTIYPLKTVKTNNIIMAFRAFFYPLIFSYHNTNYE